MRSAPASSLTKPQVLSTLVILPSGPVKFTLPMVVAESPAMNSAELATSHFDQPLSAKPVSFGNAALPPTK